MSETKRGQQIILLHGDKVFGTKEAQDVNLVKGELVIEHSADATKLHTLANDGEVATFITEAVVDSKIKTVNDVVEGHTSDIEALQTTVGNASSGLVKDVAANELAISEIQEALGLGVTPDGEGNSTLSARISELESKVGNEDAGLVKDVADNKTAIEELSSEYDAYVETNNADVAEFKATLAGYSKDNTIAQAFEDEVEARNQAIVDAFASHKTNVDDKLQAAIEAADGKAEANAEDIANIEKVLSGYDAEGSVAAAVATAKTEVKAKEVDGNHVTVTLDNSATDGHAVYEIAVTGVATAGALEELDGKVLKLIGADAQKSVRAIALDELSKQLLGEENADDNFKTLQELAAWLEGHPESAAEMNDSISNLTKALADYTTENAVKNQFTKIGQDIEGLESSKVSVGDYNAKMALLDAEDEKLGKAIAQEVTDRQGAIEGVEELVAAETEARGLLNDRVVAIEDVYISSITTNCSVTATVDGEDKHKWNFDFSALVLDGGTY